jgi:hypothetical protein
MRSWKETILWALLATAGSWTGASAGNRIIGAVAPEGGAYLVKRFDVPAGAAVTGVEFTANDARTVFPQVLVLRGPLQRLAEGKVLAEAAAVRSDAEMQVTLSWTRVEMNSGGELYVAVELPASAGIDAAGRGDGIVATQLARPGSSYFAAGEEDHLGAMDVEYELELRYSTAGKARSEGAEDKSTIPAVADARARPNPFNPSVTVEFDVPRVSYVEAEIFDVTGRRLRRLVHGIFPAGKHEQVWDGRSDSHQPVAGGNYVLRVAVGEQRFQRKIVLVK